MARKPRIHVPGLLYHVICRGNQRQVVFKDDQDHRAYLFRLAETHTLLPFRLYAWALMPNHVHLLIEAGEIPLSRVMQTLQQRYTQHFNAKYRTVGHLFHGRFKAIICQREEYLLELVRYLHLNPVRANLAKNPAEYPWTSHNAYLAKGADGWLDRDAILMQFGKERQLAQKRYADFVAGGIGQGHRDDLYDAREQLFLGNDDFAKTLPIGETPSRKRRGPQEADRPSLKQLAERLDAELASPPLKGKFRAKGSVARGLLCLVAREKGYSAREVAAFLGVSLTALHQSSFRTRDLLRSAPELRAIKKKVG